MLPGSLFLCVPYHCDSEDEEAESYWEEIHEVSSNLMLLLVFLHIGGAIISSRLYNEHLVRAMVTGNKARRPEQGDFFDIMQENIQNMKKTYRE